LPRQLYDTNGVDRLTVLLRDTALTEPTRVTLTQTLLQHGPEVEIRMWEELSLFYTGVKDMFDIIFLFHTITQRWGHVIRRYGYVQDSER
jgi:putative ABC transport system permease protein